MRTPIDRLVAIDPGTKVVAFAVFEGGELTLVQQVRAEDVESLIANLREYQSRSTMVGEAWETVVEVPQIYAQSRSKADPNDLVKLALAAGGAAVVAGGVVRLVRPREWKGSTPKEIHNRRVLDKLRPAELDVLAAVGLPASLMHNAIDAVGIGLWRLGR